MYILLLASDFFEKDDISYLKARDYPNTKRISSL